MACVCVCVCVCTETWPVVFYGLCNTIQHSIFCIQYVSTPHTLHT